MSTELEEELYGHYLSNCGDDAGYYYREAEESGLVGVYNLGLERGRATVTEKLVELSKRVKASLHVEFNPHNSFYEPADSYYKGRRLLTDEMLKSIDFDKDIWTLQVYFKTPISFYYFAGNDLEALVDEALTVDPNA